MHAHTRLAPSLAPTHAPPCLPSPPEQIKERLGVQVVASSIKREGVPPLITSSASLSTFDPDYSDGQGASVGAIRRMEPVLSGAGRAQAAVAPG
jgi:hypothetical protein